MRASERIRFAVALMLAGLAAACGPKDTDPAPGGVTVAEARALDDAAEMLEQRRLPPEATADEKTPDASPKPAVSPASSPSPVQ
jgi:hypothetical protein